MFFLSLYILNLVGASLWSTSSSETKEVIKDPSDYGVDVTFPVHHYLKEDNFFKRRYDGWMEGCYKEYSKRECDATERARLEMSMEQTASQYNYTKTGSIFCAL
jgi:hypothetical protein